MTSKSRTTTPKIPQAGRSVLPLQIHTVKKPHGKSYSYRGHKLTLWFSEDEIRLLESAYHYMKKTKHQDFSDKERSTISKFLKAVLLKYSSMIKEKFIDEK